jgi:hypothetical protein
VEWFRDEGFGVDIAKLRELNPNLTNMETFLKDSKLAKKVEENK